tara:strand:+ start:1113 stop:1367 length:255 start_codon:yes stop_codon:yes gene_type:complete
MADIGRTPLDDFYLSYKAKFVLELCKMGYVQEQVEWFLKNKGLCEVEIDLFEAFFLAPSYKNALSFTKNIKKEMPFDLEEGSAE